MLTLSSNTVHTRLAHADLLDRAQVMSLAQWFQHFQAETVDLRYFFHSGWSS
ncbi:MAG: hypothetical protein NWP51_06605 [Marinomonas hwangdonensis]|nr:hypothetical protein [Marinomonas hwangdonensis]